MRGWAAIIFFGTAFNVMPDYTFVCEDNIDGILTAVYDAWRPEMRGDIVHLHPGTVSEYSFLTEYIDTPTDIQKSMRVADSIRNKISPRAFKMIYRACMHYSEDRADAVMRFLKIGYRVGAPVTKRLGDDAVMRVMELSRKAVNEADKFKGFVRFNEYTGFDSAATGGKSLLLGHISPKCDVLPLIAYHFTERYPVENWMIYDDTRQKALVHPSGKDAFFLSGPEAGERVESLERTHTKDNYETLWKVFFDTIEIESRRNLKCQRTNLPKWYREHMTEF